MSDILMRNAAPQFESIKSLDLCDTKVIHLDNGIPVYLIEAGSQNVTKLDLILPAGSVQADRPLVSSFTSTLIAEGTKNKTSVEISELIDFHGAYIGQQTNYHYTTLTLLTLTKHLNTTLNLFQDILLNPTFPQHEFDVLHDKRKQEFLIDSQKVRNIAARKFNEVIFGENHPYGKVAKLNHFDEINRDHLIEFHNSNYTPEGTKIIIAGQPGKDIIEILNKTLGAISWKGKKISDATLPEITPSKEKIHLTLKEDATQSALRIGKPTITKDHPDFIPLQVLNTILGGYFGSRLMNNLREDKGFTYGISSFLVPYRNCSFITVSSEVIAEKREAAVSEILKELNELQQHKVDEKELTLVKNYMMGEMLRNLDGPFAISDNLRGLLDFDLDISYYQSVVNNIQEITTDKLLSLAQKHFNPEDFYQVIAGK